MDRPVKFSLEYKAFNGRPATTYRDIIESYANEAGIETFLNGVHSFARGYPAYADMLEFRDDFNLLYGSGSLIGEAFMDGSALAIDSLDRFNPELLEGVHNEIVKARANLMVVHLGSDPSKSEESKYLSQVRAYGAELSSIVAKDYKTIMGKISAFRRYTHSPQYTGLLHGFTFVMKAAGKAYDKDLETFAAEAVEEMSKPDAEMFAELIGHAAVRSSGPKHVKSSGYEGPERTT